MRAKTLTIHTHYHLSSDSGEVDSIIERMHLKHIFLTKKTVENGVTTDVF